MWHGNQENCDICQKKFEKVFYDAKTKMGPWGLLCEDCFQKNGIGLGTGRGQKYDFETKEKLEG